MIGSNFSIITNSYYTDLALEVDEDVFVVDVVDVWNKGELFIYNYITQQGFLFRREDEINGNFDEHGTFVL